MIEVTVFFYNLAVNFANVVQYNKVNRAFEVSIEVFSMMHGKMVNSKVHGKFKVT